MGLAGTGQNAVARQKHRDSLIPALFDVVVRQGSCEDDPILIRNKISAASTRKNARENKPTVSRCIFCGEPRRSRECLATRFMAGKKALAGPLANSKRKRSAALQSAARDRHPSAAGVKDFFRARFSSIQRTRAQNLAAAL